MNTTGTVGRSTTIHAVNETGFIRCGADRRYRNGGVSLHRIAQTVTCKKCLAKD